ncbi:Uncharacterised protein [Vibrio cholerae]|nr:Uncharacterised protein [Vibrio cholerae]
MITVIPYVFECFYVTLHVREFAVADESTA